MGLQIGFFNSLSPKNSSPPGNEPPRLDHFISAIGFRNWATPLELERAVRAFPFASIDIFGEVNPGGKLKMNERKTIATHGWLECSLGRYGANSDSFSVVDSRSFEVLRILQGKALLTQYVQNGRAIKPCSVANLAEGSVVSIPGSTIYKITSNAQDEAITLHFHALPMKKFAARGVAEIY